MSFEFNSNENIPKEPSPEDFVSYEESQKLAKELIHKHKTELEQYSDTGHYFRKNDIAGEEPGIYQLGFDGNLFPYYLKMIPAEIQEHYYGHGVSRGGGLNLKKEEDLDLSAVLNISANKIIKGDVALLHGNNMDINRGTGTYQNAYKEAHFLVLSKKDESFNIPDLDNPKYFKSKLIDGEHHYLSNIGAIVVNYQYYPLVQDIQKIFPDMKIIKANQIPEYFGIETKHNDWVSKVFEKIKNKNEK